MKSNGIKVGNEYIFSKNEDLKRIERRKGRVLAEIGSYFLVQHRNYKTCYNKCDINCGYIAVKELRGY